MAKKNLFLGIHARPPQWLQALLLLLPFLLVVGSYAYFSHQRLSENEMDKVLPSLTQMVEAVKLMAFTEDTRTGEYLMLVDTLASLKRIGVGVGLAALLGLFSGLFMGLLPGVRSLSLTFITVISIIPPLAVMPILMIAFGVEEFGKIALIFIGTFPIITRDIFLKASSVPREQIIKSLSLGANQFQVLFTVVLPQMMPKLLETLRICLGSAWLFLIAAEAIASTEGLGYRIFLVRRYLSMDIIIPYAMWITVLGISLDHLLRLAIKSLYPWYAHEQK